MKTNYFKLMAAFVLAMVLSTSFVKATEAVIAPGDYVFLGTASSEWFDVSNWGVYVSEGVYSTPTLAPNSTTPQKNVWIPAGKSVTSAPTFVTATATATITDGALTGFTITNPGVYYSNVPTVTLAGGGFTTAATATAIVANGVITGFTITNVGAGYTSAPTVTIGAPSIILEAYDVHVSGTLTIGNTLTCQNVYVASTGLLVSNQLGTATKTINIGGRAAGTIEFIIDGTVGTKTQGADGEIYLTTNYKQANTTYTIGGTGSIGLNGIGWSGTSNATANYGTSVVYKNNVTITKSDGTFGLEYRNDLKRRTMTVDEGVTITLLGGKFFNSNNPATLINCNFIYNINGRIDASLCSAANITTTNNVATDSTGMYQKIQMNIGANGRLDLPATTRWFKTQATQTLEMNVADGGKLTIAGTAFTTAPSAATVVSLPLVLKNAEFTNVGDIAITGDLVVNGSLTSAGTSLAVSGTLLNLGALNGTAITGGKIINVSSANAAQGAVAGSLAAGVVTLTAAPVSGFVFSKWNEGATEISTTNPYVFTPAASQDLVASFVVDLGTGFSNAAKNAFVVVAGRNLKLSADVLSAELYNGVGQLISRHINNSTVSVNNSGIFIVKMNTLQGAKVQKVIVR